MGYTNDKRRPSLAHLQSVVAIAATDIEYLTALKRQNGVRNSCPLPVAAPFGIDRDTADVEWTLAPWREVKQKRPQLLRIGRRVRQRRDDLLPACKVAVRFGGQSALQ